MSDSVACPTLPSSESASDLLDGKPGAFGRAASHMLLRAGLIATGMYVAGVRGSTLVRGAIGGAVAIEVFVIAYLAMRRQQEAAAK